MDRQTSGRRLRAKWLEAAKKVLAGDSGSIPCPKSDDEFLVVEWLPSRDGGSGEYHLRFATYGVETYIRKSLANGLGGVDDE